jgi:hypothetical protein
MAPYITCPDVAAQKHKDGVETPNQRWSASDKIVGLGGRPGLNDATVSSFFPDRIPVLRWARSGVSIIEFLGHEIDSPGWDADKLDGAGKETELYNVTS